MADKLNLTSVSSKNVNFPKGGERQSNYASKKVLGNVASGGGRRAVEYELESQKK